MTASTSSEVPPTASAPRETLVGLIETLEDVQYQSSSPAFQPLTRIDGAVVIGVYVLIPVIVAIVALL